MLINYEPRYGMSLNTSDLTRLTKYVEDDSDSNHHFHVIISISEPICRLCDKYGHTIPMNKHQKDENPYALLAILVLLVNGETKMKMLTRSRNMPA